MQRELISKGHKQCQVMEESKRTENTDAEKIQMVHAYRGNG